MKIRIKTYVIYSTIICLILIIPWLMSWNVIGEGVQGGSAEFLPDALYPYTEWYPEHPEAKPVSPVIKQMVIGTAYVILFVFPIALLNLVIVLPSIYIRQAILKRKIY